MTVNNTSGVPNWSLVSSAQTETASEVALAWEGDIVACNIHTKIIVWNISDRKKPVEVCRIDTGTNLVEPGTLFIHRNTVIIGELRSIKVWNFNDPSDLVIKDVVSYHWSVAKHGNFLITGGNSYIDTFDLDGKLDRRCMVDLHAKVDRIVTNEKQLFACLGRQSQGGHYIAHIDLAPINGKMQLLGKYEHDHFYNAAAACQNVCVGIAENIIDVWTIAPTKLTFTTRLLGCYFHSLTQIRLHNGFLVAGDARSRDYIKISTPTLFFTTPNPVEKRTSHGPWLANAEVSEIVAHSDGVLRIYQIESESKKG